MSHVYSRLSGYGWSLLPYAPYLFERVADAPETTVRVIRERPAEVWSVRVDVEKDPPHFVACEAPAPDDVVELTPGPAGPWRIETSVYTIAWPVGFAISSTPEGAPSAVDLIGPEGALVFVQGPFPAASVVPQDRMIGPGQRLASSGESSRHRWIELSYEHDGGPWVQRHYVFALSAEHVLVTTAQAPADRRALVVTAADGVMASIAAAGTAPGR